MLAVVSVVDILLVCFLSVVSVGGILLVCSLSVVSVFGILLVCVIQHVGLRHPTRLYFFLHDFSTLLAFLDLLYLGFRLIFVTEHMQSP